MQINPLWTHNRPMRLPFRNNSTQDAVRRCSAPACYDSRKKSRTSSICCVRRMAGSEPRNTLP